MCIAVGPKGTRSVCVCQSHQNAQLLVAALLVDVDYHDVLSRIVGNLQNRDCMLHACNRCSVKEALQDYLRVMYPSV